MTVAGGGDGIEPDAVWLAILRIRVSRFGFRVSGVGFRLFSGFWFLVSSFGFWVLTVAGRRVGMEPPAETSPAGPTLCLSVSLSLSLSLCA